MSIDWFAGIFKLAGLYMIGNQNKWGFVLTVAGNITFIAAAFIFGMYGLLMMAIPATALDIRNFIKWYRDVIVPLTDQEECLTPVSAVCPVCREESPHAIHR